MDCSLPASSVLEIFQARILEWVAISFSRGWIPAKYTFIKSQDPLSSQEPKMIVMMMMLIAISVLDMRSGKQTHSEGQYR